jgi:hypothetical protein
MRHDFRVHSYELGRVGKPLSRALMVRWRELLQSFLLPILQIGDYWIAISAQYIEKTEFFNPHAGQAPEKDTLHIMHILFSLEILFAGYVDLKNTPAGSNCIV